MAASRRGPQDIAWRLLCLTALACLIASCSSAPRSSGVVVEKKNRAAEYTEYGNRAYAEGNYASALSFFQQALATNLSVDNEAGVAQSLSSAGKVHVAVGDLAAAEEVFARASRIAAGLDDDALRLQCAVNLGELLIRRERPAEARTLLSGALGAETAMSGTRDLAILYHTLAVAEKKTGSLDEARKHVELALSINLTLKATEDAASNYYLLSSIHSKLGDYSQALQAALQALEADKGVENSLGIAQDLTALGIISTRLGRSQDAFGYLERAHGIYSALQHAQGLKAVLPLVIEAATAVGKKTEADAYAAQLAAIGDT